VLEEAGDVLGIVLGLGLEGGLAGVAGEDGEGFAVGVGLGLEAGEFRVAVELAEGLADVREGADDVEGVAEAEVALDLRGAFRFGGIHEGGDLGAGAFDGGLEEGGEEFHGGKKGGGGVSGDLGGLAPELFQELVDTAVDREAVDIRPGEAGLLGGGLHFVFKGLGEPDGDRFGHLGRGLRGLVRVHGSNVVKLTTCATKNVVKMISFGYINDVSDTEGTPKIVSAPIRMSPDLAAKVEEAKRLTGLAQADILRLALAIGLEDLRRVGFDLPKAISMSARPELESAASKTVPFQAKQPWQRGDAPARTAEDDSMPPATIAEKRRGGGYWLDGRGAVAAGAPIDAVEWAPVEVPKEFPEDHYVLKVNGNSMAPKIPDEAMIVVREWREQGFPKKGTIVVYSDANGSTLKEFGYRKAREGEEANSFGMVPVLKSLNPASKEVQTMEGGKIDAVFVEVL
jgi:hypothetical protein